MLLLKRAAPKELEDGRLFAATWTLGAEFLLNSH